MNRCPSAKRDDDYIPAAGEEARVQAAAEVATLALLTPIFLIFAPDRLDLYFAMALLFLCYVVAGARRTRRLFWAAAPSSRRKHRTNSPVIAMTLVGLLAFGLWAAWRGHPLRPAGLVLGVGLYFPWALVQQTIFQFYFLGRLRALMPMLPPGLLAAVNGVAYGLVHLPDTGVALLAAPAGALWSYAYLQERAILPLAASHAMLGVAYYHLVVGRDPLTDLIQAMRAGAG